MKKAVSASSTKPEDILHRRVTAFYTAVQDNPRVALLTELSKLDTGALRDLKEHSSNKYDSRMSKMSKIVFRDAAEPVQEQADKSQEALDAAQTAFEPVAQFLWCGGLWWRVVISSPKDTVALFSW